MSATELITTNSSASATFEALARLIRNREARVGVIGLGYVGLPLALTLNDAGFPVTGIDLDENRVQRLCDRTSYVTDVGNNELAKAMDGGRFKVTSDAEVIRELDAVIICVPTPLRKSKEPDLSYVMSAVDMIASRLRSGQLIILESTTYPGTTEELILPQLEKAGCRVGSDCFLAYSPERVDPGNKEFSTRNIPKIVGGITSRCAELAALLYGLCVDRTMTVSSTRVAEMVKLLENTFRNVNVALANEIALMCAHMQIDVWEVIRAAKTKPFGFMPFYPGPGLGGHCIPIDPIYLLWKAKSTGFEPRFIELADSINSGMPRAVVLRAMELMNQRGMPLKGSRVHILGVTYKKDISDTRESPAIEIVKLLSGCGATVSYTDSFASELEVDGQRLQSTPATSELLEGSDLVMIVTDHSNVDYRTVADRAPLVFDTRNATEGIHSDNIVRL
ncbi:MAG TPA: nucleotide sugar dehydrogenase [Terriglobia bacterium]|nr:nucleotide sugar dehydrogenase [Terriglobia bacterium]